MSAMKSPRITVCICTFNRYDLLPKAIDSALAQTLDPEKYRIIVVDNSPDYATALAFSQQYASQELITYHIEKKPGLSNARNVGANMCGTEFISFMDDDAIAEPHWLAKILEAFDAFGSSVSVVGG